MATANDSSSVPAASWPMYRALVGVGVVCGLLIVSVYVLTLPVIARNEAEFLQQAVFEVIPGAVSSSAFAWEAEGDFRRLGEGESGAQAVHAGYDAQGHLLGVAIAAQGMGYQDIIRILYGYDPARQAIVGMQVLASKETPGLGDRIEKDPAFLANFTALDVTVAADGVSIEDPIVAVKNGEKTAPWQIDGITGATISSVAIANILARSSAQWVPRLHAKRGELVKAREGGNEH